MKAVVVLVALLAASAALAGGASSPRQLAVVETGPAPCGITARAGKVWIGVYETGQVLSLDGRSGRRESMIAVGPWPCRVVVGPTAIWAARDRAGELVRVSRSTGRIARAKVGTGAFGVLVASGSVWTTSYDHAVVVRTDPRTLRPERRYRPGPNPAGIASCGGRVWVGHGRSATWVTAIDPRTHRLRRIDVGSPTPRQPDCIRGVVWVTTVDSVVRVDPADGRVLSRLRIGETLAQAAEGPDGLVWVTDKQHSVVHRLDQGGTRVVDTFPAGPAAFGLVRVGDAMWVTSFAGSDVRRFAP
jgi:streptogramin lyase